MQSIKRLCAATFVAAGLLLVPAAHAQAPSSPAPSMTGPGQTPAPQSIPDSKLDAAAVAVKNVSSIRDEFERKLAKAPATERQRLASEADDAMAKAVTDQGLSVEEYNTILQVAQSDPGVRNKLLQRLQ